MTIHLNFKGKKLANIIIPRVIPVPKIRFLPLITVLTALSALGGGFAFAIKNGKEQLAEGNHHNKHMESIAMGKGLNLKPYKTEYALYYSPALKNY